jgi:hypothetical protein
MNLKQCAQCGVGIEIKGIQFRGKTFCGDECCEKFDASFADGGAPGLDDFDDGLDDEDFDEDDLGIKDVVVVAKNRDNDDDFEIDPNDF